MNIGIISDIHGNYNALKYVLNDMIKENIDSVIILGDIIFDIDNKTEPQKCYDTIKQLKPIVWIRGNTDDWFNEIDDSFQPQNEMETKIFNEFVRVNKLVSSEVGDKLKVLKEKEEIEIEGKRILCVHGSDQKINEPIGIMTPQDEIRSILKRIEQDILLCGHTHTPYLVAYEGKLIMNVGSVGLPKDEKRASYGILKFESDNFEYSIRRVKIISED